MSVAPRVSIGLPVYNGEEFLREALDSLLAQDFTAFELIVSDNASCDATEPICRSYEADPRVRYLRNAENIGATANFARLPKLARGDYFMWAAHDDRWEPSFVSKCVAQLDAHPEAVLCFSQVRFMDEHDAEVNDIPVHRLHTLGMDVRQRVRDLLKGMGWFAIYGLARREAMQGLTHFNVWGHDVVVLLQLALAGNFLDIPEPLFHSRVIRKIVDDVMASIDPANRDERHATPYTDLARCLLRVVDASALTQVQKWVMRSDLIQMLALRNPCWRRLLLDENPGLADFTGPEAGAAGTNDVSLLAQLLSAPFRSGP